MVIGHGAAVVIRLRSRCGPAAPRGNGAPANFHGAPAWPATICGPQRGPRLTARSDRSRCGCGRGAAESSPRLGYPVAPGSRQLHHAPRVKTRISPLDIRVGRSRRRPPGQGAGPVGQGGAGRRRRRPGGQGTLTPAPTTPAPTTPAPMTPAPMTPAPTWPSGSLGLDSNVSPLSNTSTD